MKKSLPPFKKGSKTGTESAKNLNSDSDYLTSLPSLVGLDMGKRAEMGENICGVSIIRHYSEEDFRQMYSGKFDNGQRPSVHSQGQSQQILSQKRGKKQKQIIKVIQKSPSELQRTTKMERSMMDRSKVRPNELKQTCSTQSAKSAEVKMESERPVPKFLRDKQTRNPCLYESKAKSSGFGFLHRQNFRIILKLGEGKFGKVFLVKDVVSGMVLAMKIIQKKRIILEGLLEQFIRQLKIQSFARHPHIIELYGFFHDTTHFYTLMELGCDGQLYALMSAKKVFSEESTSFVTKGLLEAIDYLHRNRILHRDLKPENIVLIMGNVKICDFGWAVNKAHSAELRSTYCGTPFYLSPELLQGNRYDEKVDLWAIGILAYELLLGSSPFDLHDQGDLQKIVNMLITEVTDEVSFPKGKEISKDFKQLIELMLTKNPKQRLASDKLLRLDFITKYSEFETCEQICN